jgi:hypothetical protein
VIVDRVDPFENLEKRLQWMDYSFYMSDSAHVRSAGYENKARLTSCIRECAQIDRARTQELCEQNIPTQALREYQHAYTPRERRSEIELGLG